MLFGYALVFIIVAVLMYVVFDFFRFTYKKNKTEKKEAPEGYKTDAGGYLFVQGNRTYYTMPNGERRKIAEYAMDLSAGSDDMKMFSTAMNNARMEHEAEKRDERAKAVKNVTSVAKEVAKNEA